MQLLNPLGCWIVDGWMIWHPRGYYYPPAHPPHFSTLMKWWMRNRGSIVRQWMGGWMGIGDAAAGDARIHLSSKPKISLHVTHWWGWKSSCFGLFSSLFTFLVFGNFVDYVHVNAWIRELWQQCSITVPLVGAPLSEGETPRCGYRPFPTTEAEGTHFLSQTHIGKTRGEEEKGAEKKCWWELAPALPTNPPFHNKTPFNLLISKPNMQIVLITKFLWF